MNYAKFLINRAMLYPDRPAILFEGKSVSYKQLNERSNRWANAFSELGVHKGDRVGILLMNCSEFVEACYGLANICRDSGLRSLVFGSEFTEVTQTLVSRLGIEHPVCVGSPTPPWAKECGFVYLHSLSEPELAEDGAVLMYTAGTTGNPKGAVHSHQEILWSMSLCFEDLDYRPADRILLVLPLFHAFGFVTATGAVRKACTSLIMRAFDPRKLLETLRKERIDTFSAVPTMLEKIAQVPRFEEYMSNVRWLMTGGAPCAPSLIRTYLDKGIMVWGVYASTEAGTISLVSPQDFLEKGSAGSPSVYNDVRILDENGFDVKAGQVGEILVKGPGVMKEYWNNPEATKEAFKDGWFRTGDLARMDQDNHLYIVERKKDMIISGGENIYPAEVEAVLLAHPKIQEVAVVGQPDEVWGESVCAVVHPKPSETLTHDEVAKFCAGKIARFKIPKRTVLLDQPLPRNAAGKVLRRVVRTQLNPEGTIQPPPS
jgi:fatty-acyl-CoA synthase